MWFKKKVPLDEAIDGCLMLLRERAFLLRSLNDLEKMSSRKRVDLEWELIMLRFFFLRVAIMNSQSEWKIIIDRLHFRFLTNLQQHHKMTNRKMAALEHEFEKRIQAYSEAWNEVTGSVADKMNTLGRIFCHFAEIGNEYFVMATTYVGVQGTIHKAAKKVLSRLKIVL